ncbi:MAG: hypothetical protein ACFFBD_07600, partial [Candidatus Hodarchaeota archaeon]
NTANFVDTLDTHPINVGTETPSTMSEFKQDFLTLDVEWDWESPANYIRDLLNNAPTHAGEALGSTTDWDRTTTEGQERGTSRSNHGFDLLMVFSGTYNGLDLSGGNDNNIGGIACGNTIVSMKGYQADVLGYPVIWYSEEYHQQVSLHEIYHTYKCAHAILPGFLMTSPAPRSWSLCYATYSQMTDSINWFSSYYFEP